MVVLYPVETIFKDINFVLKYIFRIFVLAAILSCCLTILTWFLTDEIPIFLCSPFVDLTKSVTLVPILTWIIVVTQVGVSVSVLIVYISLIMSLKKSQQSLKEATSRKQSHLLLFIQIFVVSCSNMIC